MFFNISNHPSTRWSDAQLAAAKELAGEIIDVPFPNVPASATSEEVENMANEIVTYVLSAHTMYMMDHELDSELVCSMVQGEMTLTYMLVEKLIQFETQVVAACSERLSVENPDGSKTVQFEFVQFRKY